MLIIHSPHSLNEIAFLFFFKMCQVFTWKCVHYCIIIFKTTNWAIITFWSKTFKKYTT